ncbi:MAG: FkbM family methyltransferase [Candidatus Kuenenia stuttgartiensis]|nr:FkbM family methyltransferase [Candidatus Kuenenia stuttgartiensis]
MRFFTQMCHLAKRLKQLIGISNNPEKLIIPTEDKFQHRPLKFYQTPIGNYYLPADTTKDCIANDMKSGKIFEPEIVDVVSEYIKKDTIVLDIGANFGQMSLLFSQLTGEDGQVFSFEADDYIFYVLQQNIMANNCHNIRAFLGAVYDQTGKVMFYPVQDFKKFSAYGSYGLEPKATNGRRIETIAIDDLKIDREISFMKVDVQGSDLFAMRGAIETIKRHKMPIIFEFEQQFQNEFDTSFQDYLDFITSISYKVEKIIYNINYLLVPDSRKIFSMAANITITKNSNTIKLSRCQSLCKFLQSRSEIDECTAFLYRNGFVSHNIKCKDWDLAHIIPKIYDGNFLDIGSSDSYILKNLALKKIRGELYGIDLREPNVPVKGVKYLIGNLMDTKLPDKFFKNITCLSVIEHEIDFTKFTHEVARLLEDNGRLFVTFDYWNPKITSNVKLYGLSWQPLDEQSVKQFIAECKANGLYLVQDMDWTINEAVIRDGYYSPDPTLNYTFGIVVFEKQ